MSLAPTISLPPSRQVSFDPPDGDFLDKLDRKMARANERHWRKLIAWAEVLDAAGWCVALDHPDGSTWISHRAGMDLAERKPGHGLADSLGSGARNGRGVRVWAATRPAAPAPVEVALTRREAEIFGWLKSGKIGPEIAVILGCSVRTVEKHVQNLYRKIGVKNRVAAILNPGA